VLIFYWIEKIKPKSGLYSQFITQRRKEREGRKVVVLKLCVLLSREGWGEGHGGGSIAFIFPFLD
jgi:hypothetical protein